MPRESTSEGSMPRTKHSDGSMPRVSTSEGSIPRIKHSDGSMPRLRATKENVRFGISTSDTPSPESEAGMDPRERRRKRQSDARDGNEEVPYSPSPGGLFTPPKRLTDAEHALAARRARLRREASAVAEKVSAAEKVR